VKQKRFNVEQIVAMLKQAEAGVPLAELIRRVGISEQTFYRWKKQYVHKVVSRENGREIRVCEIIALEQYRFASHLSQGIGEAIPEIQTRRMSAPLAEIAVGFAGNPRLGLSNRLNDELCLSEEIVKPSARNGISASIDDNCGLDVIDGRNAAAAHTGNGLRT
jgi:Transposase